MATVVLTYVDVAEAWLQFSVIRTFYTKSKVRHYVVLDSAPSWFQIGSSDRFLLAITLFSFWPSIDILLKSNNYASDRYTNSLPYFC